MESSKAPSFGLTLQDDEFFFIAASGGRNFSIPRIHGAWFDPGMTTEVALELVRAFQKQIRKYSDFRQFQRLA